MSKIIPKWRCRVDNGKIHWENIIKDTFDGWLRNLPDGFYDMTLKSPHVHSLRSNEQNRYYWGVVVHLISEHLGYTEEETHKILKEQSLTKPMRVGSKFIDITQSTTDLNTLGMENYLEKCRIWASTELGIRIPEPNEIE